jgi:CRISPR/Cas system CSM-associated protein Csm3 (group 7 of RAMP superfamily)
MTRLELELRFRLDTALHVTGNRRLLGIDRPLALDVQGRPVMPATTVKGFLRHRAEVLLRALGQRACLGPAPDTMCGSDDPCLVCRVFGNPHLDAALRVGEAISEEQTTLSVRSGVAISRYRRAAYPQRLFFLETTGPMPSTWRSTCEGYFSNEEMAKEAAALVDLAARWPLAIGGGKTRGLGWIRDIDLTAKVNGTSVERQELAAIWQAWAGGQRVAAD